MDVSLPQECAESEIRPTLELAGVEAVNQFEAFESQVRTYCRTWPAVFESATGSRLRTETGRTYLDFFAGAGALNYGHNHRVLKAALLEYVQRDGLTHSLDMYSTAKRTFLETFFATIVRPRGLDYKVMFPGPSGSSAVEAALKLARKVTGRERIAYFSKAFHGMTEGAMSVSDPAFVRPGVGRWRFPTTDLRYGCENAQGLPDLADLIDVLDVRRSRRPAAAIVESVQCEGGINLASSEWLRQLASICRQYEVLLVLDDIQAGCGRTGAFFSFEDAGVRPDIVTLSKALSGYGLPLAVTLSRPELDVWSPGEHSGTFRGCNPAFVTGEAALRLFWGNSGLEDRTRARHHRIESFLREACTNVDAMVRGRGMVFGIAFAEAATAKRVSSRAFELGLLVETCGVVDEVVRLLPPLTISDSELEEGLAILQQAIVDATAVPHASL